MSENDEKIKGLGISRDQLKKYLTARMDQGDMRPLVVKEMYTREDDDYTLVTESTREMVMNKVRLRVIEAAYDLKRTKPLTQVFREALNLEMIPLGRKGRLELLGALQMLSAEDEGGSERPVSLGGK